MEQLVSAREMAEREKKRQQVKKEIYRVILNQFSRKISTSFELGVMEVDLTVPSFVIGYPRYDLASAVRYLGRQLELLGYTVTRTGPCDYRVTWVKKAPEEEQEVITPEFEFPSLMNLKKTAEKIKKR
jgi:hypothetical protein